MEADYNPRTHTNKTHIALITCTNKVQTLIGTFLTVDPAFLPPTYYSYCSSIQYNNVRT